jgi:hypothetical protein
MFMTECIDSTVFLYQDKNPESHLGLGRQFCVSLRTGTPKDRDEMFYLYESINRELKTRPINECRCDERLKSNVEESTHLTCTGLFGELEHG